MSENELNKYSERMQGREPLTEDTSKKRLDSDNGSAPAIDDESE